MNTPSHASRARPGLLAVAVASALLSGCAANAVATETDSRTTGPYPLRIVRTAAPGAADTKPAAETAKPAAPTGRETRRAPGAYPLRA